MDLKISVVSTLYFSAPYIREFYDRIKATLIKMGVEHEIIFVNDGSPDNSLDIALEILNNDDNVRIIDLSRNFGHQKAIMTGLSQAKGELIFLIDSDLEEEPELLEKFYEEWLSQKDNVDVIYGVQQVRSGMFFNRLAGSCYKWMFNVLSGEKLPINSCVVRIMTQRFVKSLISHRDKNVYLVGIFAITGFRQSTMPISRKYKGSSSYTFMKKLSLALDGITSFSNRPLLLILLLGLIISFLSLIFGFYFIYRKLLYGVSVGGWTSLMVSLYFLCGVIIFSIGTVGLYVAKVFIEVKSRPYTVIRSIFTRTKENGINKI